MPMISYAQNREDVILARVFREPTGFYIDVGAAHPSYHSVTKWFYDRGWSGINVEPQPTNYKAIVDARPRDINLNVAVSDHNGEAVFHELAHSVSQSTLEAAVADDLVSTGAALHHYPVTLQTLDRICEAHADRPIDFLKIDVEGHEREALLGLDLRRWRPRVLVIEATKPCGPEPSHGDWEPIVLAQGYYFAFFDGLNRYYVRPEDEALIPRLAVCPNVFDDYVPYEVEAIRDDEQRALAVLKQTRDEVASIRSDEQRALALLEQTRGELYGLQVGRQADAATIQAARAEVDLARGEAERARTEADQARGEAERARAEVGQARGETHAARGETHAARGELAQARSDLELARGETRRVREKWEETLATLKQTQDNFHWAKAARDEARAQLAASRTIIAELTAELTATQQVVNEQRAEFARTLSTMVKRTTLDRALTILASTNQHLDTLRTHTLTQA